MRLYFQLLVFVVDCIGYMYSLPLFLRNRIYAHTILCCLRTQRPLKSGKMEEGEEEENKLVLLVPRAHYSELG